MEAVDETVRGEKKIFYIHILRALTYRMTANRLDVQARVVEISSQRNNKFTNFMTLFEPSTFCK